MARLVPARPRLDTIAVEAVALAVESGLDDSHVVFQGAPVEGFLVLRPGFTPVLVSIVEGDARYDPDDGMWNGFDVGAVARSAAQALPDRPGAAPPTCVLHLPDVSRPAGGGHAKVAFGGETAGLPALIAGLMRPASIDASYIDAVVASVSPGAKPYGTGGVTDAQAKWRASSSKILVGDSSGVVPADPTAMAPGLPDRLPVAPSTGATPEFPADGVVVVSSAPGSAAPRFEGPEFSINDPLGQLLLQAVETVTEGAPIFLKGVQVMSEDVIGPDLFLPALLLAAAQDFAPVVSAKGGQGGFHVRMKSDFDNSLLGYRVVSIVPATPFLLTLPVVDRLRRAMRDDELDLDATADLFGRWLTANGLDATACDDLRFRVAVGQVGS